MRYLSVATLSHSDVLVRLPSNTSHSSDHIMAKATRSLPMKMPMVQLTIQSSWFLPKRPIAIPTKTFCYRSVLQDHCDWFPLRNYYAPYGHHCQAHVDVASEKTLSTRTMTTPRFHECNGHTNDKNISQPSTCTCGCKLQLVVLSLFFCRRVAHTLVRAANAKPGGARHLGRTTLLSPSYLVAQTSANEGHARLYHLSFVTLPTTSSCQNVMEHVLYI
jgi:hypothetical protein